MSKHTELIERLRCFDRVTCNEAADAIESQSREITALKERVEGLRKDAERWRWATDQAEFFSMVVDGTGLHCSEVSEAEAAVDAEIAAKGVRDEP